jgi:pimeloyl-ACP methyl ester carboxylesterase
MPTRDIEGYPLSYAEAGTGAPLVLVHGTLGDQRVWAEQMQPFAAQYHVLSLSMRHTWPDTWREGGDFTIDRHVADVAAFIRALGTGPAYLCGHSRGGHIAFRVAERHPELVRALVLIEPGGEIDESLGGSPAPTGQQVGVFGEAAALVGKGEHEAGVRRIAEHTSGAGAWERRPKVRQMLSLDNATTLLGQIHEKRSRYSRAAAAKIAAPTLLVIGAATQPGFKTVATALQGAIAHCERVDIPEATHSLIFDDPARVNASVLAFLARH